MAATARAVHPRVCGEQFPADIAHFRAIGSSPRVRGTVAWRRGIPGSARFIPACAGNSTVPGAWLGRVTVHPRVCGEQMAFSRCMTGNLGSSPRVRGTGPRIDHTAQFVRFIPACAGNSLGCDSRALRSAVHPRVCGEQGQAAPATQDCNGSSPRVRGTEGRPSSSTAAGRFIPACAGNSIGPVIGPLASAVHPRVCGEQVIEDRPGDRPAGSSPRVRGTVHPATGRAHDLRFIPACAGNRVQIQGAGSSIAVHPRVCGEQFSGYLGGYPQRGSSPRVRGTERREPEPALQGRFIPACAGNRFPRVRLHRRGTVHPRVCGEQFGFPVKPTTVTGSSPRVRGTVAQARARVMVDRFIPACAGNRPCRYTTRRSSSVHPRVCGEQLRAGHPSDALDGSSPRVRGTEKRSPAMKTSYRFIPACAGNSYTLRYRFPQKTVHPRVCGEQFRVLSKTPQWYGSSPRVRGTAGVTTATPASTRFIPACAGNSRGLRLRRSARTVHPRVCGEQRPCVALLLTRLGSSPRVRGTGTIPFFRCSAARFIPACAGNSRLFQSDQPAWSVHPRVCGEQT